MRLTRTIPALPVTEMGEAVEFYARRLGFVARHEDTGFAVVVRDDAEIHLWESGDGGWK